MREGIKKKPPSPPPERGREAARVERERSGEGGTRELRELRGEAAIEG